MTASKETSPNNQHAPALVSRTLFVTRYYPFPKRTGALIYTSHLIALFGRLSKSIDIVGSHYPDLLTRDAAKEKSTSPNGDYFFHPVRLIPMARVIPMAKVLISSLTSVAWPHATQKNVDNLCRCLERGPELIVLDHAGAIWAFREIAQYLSAFPKTRLIYCTHNDEVATRLSQIDFHPKGILRSVAVLVDVAKIAFWERRLFPLTHIVTTITPEEASAYARRGVETTVIRPAYEGEVLATRSIDGDTPRQVCICGSFLWSAKRQNLEAFLAANHDYLRDNGIPVVVVGNMTEDFRRRIQNQWPEAIVVGRVPSIAPYLRSSRLGLLVDESGGGFKLKILDYVFNRLPIAGLLQAAAGVPLEAGNNSLLCDDMKEIGPLIKETIDDFQKLNALQNNAFDEFQGFTSTDETLERLREIL